MLLVRRAARCPAGPASAQPTGPSLTPESKAGSAVHHHRSGEVQVEAAGPPPTAPRALGGACPGLGEGIVATRLGRGQPAVLSERGGPVRWRRADDAPITGLPRGARPAGSEAQAACLS